MCLVVGGSNVVWFQRAGNFDVMCNWHFDICAWWLYNQLTRKRVRSRMSHRLYSMALSGRLVSLIEGGRDLNWEIGYGCHHDNTIRSPWHHNQQAERQYPYQCRMIRIPKRYVSVYWRVWSNFTFFIPSINNLETTGPAINTIKYTTISWFEGKAYC